MCFPSLEARDRSLDDPVTENALITVVMKTLGASAAQRGADVLVRRLSTPRELQQSFHRISVRRADRTSWLVATRCLWARSGWRPGPANGGTRAEACPWELEITYGKLLLMEIGVAYPQNELRGDPAAVGEFGRAVEDLGFDHILSYDHVLGAVHAERTPALTGPYTEHDPFHDPFVMFAYLAAITERISFTTGILILPQRPTALVARQATDVDLLSDGRLRLGVGIGWNYVEYEALGQDFHTRGARQEEQIGLLRRLFTEPVVDFSGRFDRIDRASLVPKPTRSIPIWLGGSGQKAFDRAARLADGFLFFGGGVDRAIASWRQVRERVADLGRPAQDFGGDYVALSGADVAELIREIDAWREAGGTHVTVVTMGLGLDSVVSSHIDYLADLAGLLNLQ